MKQFIKSILPKKSDQRNPQPPKICQIQIPLLKITYDAKQGRANKIIVGAAETHQSGWHSTNEQWLDITKRKDWEKIFENKGRIKSIVAEHVFEHLTEEESKTALALILKI